jgi:lipopolysaccharide export system protein LptA
MRKNRTGNRRYAICLLALLLAAVPAAAEETADSESAEEQKQETISFAGSYTRAAMREGNESIYLSGGSWVRTGSVYIEADSIDIYGENSRFLTSRGNVVLVEEDKQITLQANTLNYDREKSSLVVNGWAELLDRENQLLARGAYLRSEEDGNRILIQVQVTILKTDDEDKEMYCRADSALYDTEADLLELTGRSEVYYDGSYYKAARILIDLETNEITMEGGVSGTIDESR